MTIHNFIKFITNKNAKEHLTQLVMEKDNKVTPLKSILFDGKSKRIYFNITSDKGNPYVNIKSITDFDRLYYSIGDFQCGFRIETKDDEVIKVHISMEDGYSPFCYDEMTKRNYEEVIKAIPKHLDTFKGKKVIISQATSSDTFTTFCEEINGSSLPITGSYIINDFDYTIYYEFSVPCVKMIDRVNKDIYAVAMGVSLVSGTTLFYAGGEIMLKTLE